MEEENLLGNLSSRDKGKLLGALAQLSLSDRELAREEKDLFGDFAKWMGIERKDAWGILEQPSDPDRLQLDDLPEKVRALVFITGTVIVLADGKFTADEKRDLAILAASLGIAPDSARETIKEIKRRSALRDQLSDAVERCIPVARRQSGWQTHTRNLFHVIGVFLGVGLGAVALPSILPGAFVGFLAGAVGGGLLGRVIAGRHRFEQTEYRFGDL